MKAWKGGPVRLATDALAECTAGKKIALMVNSTALDNEGRLLVDTVSRNTDTRFFFGMEHGVRGNLYAGDSGLEAVDGPTGLPIVNLYDYPGYCPPPEEIAKVDAVVFCAQDVGVRHWTYTPWLQRLMDGAAAAGKEVIVLDRPNPIRGDIVEGPATEPAYEGAKLLNGFGYPLRHGMTVGEIALMYNAERHVNCRLTVLPMEGYRRDMWYGDTGLPWLPPSPNMPAQDSPLYFAATGLLQSSNVSLGIGTTTPFRFVGAPWADGQALSDALNALDLPGVYCVPKFCKARHEKQENVLCSGAFLVIHDRDAFRPAAMQMHIFSALCRMYPDRFRPVTADGLGVARMGTERIVKAGADASALIPEWEEQCRSFEAWRAPYMLYE